MYGISEISYGKLNYSKNFWENSLHLLENFASPYQPPIFVEGSLWYDSANRTLKVMTKAQYGMLEWRPLKGDDIDISVYIDQYKANEISNLMLVDDISGDTVYSGDDKNDDHAVTKKYADNYHGNIKDIKSDDYYGFLYPNKYVLLYGIKAGDIILPYEMHGINYSVACSNSDSFQLSKVEKKTSTSFKVNSNNWIMVGFSI